MSVKLGLTVTGGEQLAAQLLTLSAAVRRKALLKVLKAAAVPIAGRAAELAPYDPSTARHLKEEINISAVPTTQTAGTLTGSDDFQAAVAVGPSKEAFWGLFVEFGYGPGVRSPHPFMRPAFDYGVDRAITILRAGLWQLLEDATRRTGVFERETPTTISTTSGLL